MRLRGRHYRTGQPIEISCADGRIAGVTEATSEPVDVEAGWVAPAFCDIQINGCDGHSFNSLALTPEQIDPVVGVCHRHGIAQLCPTLVTGPFDALTHGLRTLRQARD